MRSALVIIVVVCGLSALAAGQSPTCANYNTSGQRSWGASGFTGHYAGGRHYISGLLSNECNYESIGTKYCYLSSLSDAYNEQPYDNQDVNPLFEHVVVESSNTGSAISNSSLPADSSVTLAGVASACPIVIGCSLSISISGPGTGIGVSIVFPSNNLGFALSTSQQINCANYVDPTPRESLNK